MNNSVNIKLIEGGHRIKRGDKASLFRVLLLDERKEKITNIEGVKATVILKKDDEHIYKTTSKVVDGTVNFTIKDLLEQGEYILEIHAGGYVFPSSNAIRISVVKSLVDLEDEPQMSFEEKKEKLSLKVESLLRSFDLYEFSDGGRAEGLASFVQSFNSEYSYDEEEVDFSLAIFKKFENLEKTPKPITSISETYSDDGSGDIILSVYRAEATPEDIQWEIVSQTINGNVTEEPLVEFIGATTGENIRIKKYHYDFDMSISRQATIRVTYRDEVAERVIYG